MVCHIYAAVTAPVLSACQHSHVAATEFESSHQVVIDGQIPVVACIKNDVSTFVTFFRITDERFLRGNGNYHSPVEPYRHTHVLAVCCLCAVHSQAVEIFAYYLTRTNVLEYNPCTFMPYVYRRSVGYWGGLAHEVQIYLFCKREISRSAIYITLSYTVFVDICVRLCGTYGCLVTGGKSLKHRKPRAVGVERFVVIYSGKFVCCPIDSQTISRFLFRYDFSSKAH